LQAWLVKCEQMNALLSGKAHLNCIEPNLKLKLKMKERGNCEFLVSISSDTPYHEHTFLFEIDQSYLTLITQSLKALLAAYPLKATYDKHSNTC